MAEDACAIREIVSLCQRGDGETTVFIVVDKRLPVFVLFHCYVKCCQSKMSKKQHFLSKSNVSKCAVI